MAPTVTLSVGILEKLAGMRKSKEEQPQQRQQPVKFIPQLPGLGIRAHEAASAIAQDAQLRQTIQSTQRLGNLLVGHNAEELRKIDQLAKDLIKKEHSMKCRGSPCQAERERCQSCYSQNTQDPLKCAEQVRAYSVCAQKALGQLVK